MTYSKTDISALIAYCRRTTILLGIFMLLLGNSAIQAQPRGPEGYTYCADEGESFTLPTRSHVAYGANGSFFYRYNQTGTIHFNNSTFGSPIGVRKFGFYKIADNNVPTTDLSAALKKITGHLTGASSLTASQINQQAAIIQEHLFLMGADEKIIAEGLKIVELYETNIGPIFMSEATRKGFPNTPGALDGFELTRAVFLIQQGVHDEAFTAENLKKYPNLLDRKPFKTAEYFPGACPPPDNPNTTYNVIINASMSEDWGNPTAFSTTPIRRPTGYYLAPGSIGTVTVPESMVNKGFEVLVGAHTWDKTGKQLVQRFFRVNKTFPISSTTISIANPFGGGIYIVTPYLADLGLVDIQISNAVPSPFFSTKPWQQTSLKEWQEIQRNHKGPWADFESEKFMMQVPTSWIYNFDDPLTLMETWDTAMDGVSELLGYPMVRNNVVMYLQVDVSIMHGAHGIGYPQVNYTYNPHDTFNGNHDHWFIQNPIGSWMEYHELGHAQLFSAFPMEHETKVHLPGTYVANAKFGMDLDSAFNYYCPGEQGIWTLDRTAQYWMARDNFIEGNNMYYLTEMNYEHTGHAKYIDMVRLFNWDILKNLYYKEHIAHMNNTPGDGLHEVDSRIFRMSKEAQYDLTPLMHFWGRKPENPEQLRKAIKAANLPPSKRIYDQLLYYKSIIPKNNEEYLSFIKELYPNGSRSNSDGSWGWLWMTSIAEHYDQSRADKSAHAVQRIVDLYFPDGMP